MSRMSQRLVASSSTDLAFDRRIRSVLVGVLTSFLELLGMISRDLAGRLESVGTSMTVNDDISLLDEVATGEILLDRNRLAIESTRELVGIQTCLTALRLMQRNEAILERLILVVRQLDLFARLKPATNGLAILRTSLIGMRCCMHMIACTTIRT
jgi:hypothetical protein